MALPATTLSGSQAVYHAEVLTTWSDAVWVERLAVTFCDLSQAVIQRVQDATGLGVVGMKELIGFVLVALSAVARSDDSSDDAAFVIPGVSIGLVCLVAIDTGDVEGGVGTTTPMVYDARRFLLMALYAAVCSRRS